MAEPAERWMRLADAKPGQRVRLVKIAGGGNRHRWRDHRPDGRRRRGWFGLRARCCHGQEDGGSLCHRLAELGLTPGLEFRVLQRGNGPMILAVRDSRLALGRGIAERVFVVPARSSDDA